MKSVKKHLNKSVHLFAALSIAALSSGEFGRFAAGEAQAGPQINHNLPAVIKLDSQAKDIRNSSLLEQSLRDPVASKGAPSDDLEASRVLHDYTEATTDLAMAKGARRAELLERAFENSLALSYFLADMESGRISSSTSGEKLPWTLQKARQQVIEFGVALAQTSSNPGLKARAIYHVIVAKYFLGTNRPAQIGLMSSLVSPKAGKSSANQSTKLNAALASRGDLLISVHNALSTSGASRDSAQKNLPQVAKKISRVGQASSQIALAQSLARTKTPNNENTLIASSHSSLSLGSTLSEQDRVEVFSQVLSAWKISSLSKSWDKFPALPAPYRDLTAARAIRERIALQDVANNRMPEAIQKYETLAQTAVQNASSESNSLAMRVVELRRMQYIATKNPIPYEKSLVKYHQKFEDQKTTAGVVSVASEDSSISEENSEEKSAGPSLSAKIAAITALEKALVIGELNQALAPKAIATQQNTAVGLATRFINRLDSSAEKSPAEKSIELIQSRLGDLYADMNRHGEAVKTFVSLSEKVDKSNQTKYLSKAIKSQRILSNWPDSPTPWEAIPSGNKNEREHLLTLVEKRRANATEFQNSWNEIAHVGLLNISLGNRDQAFTLWQTTIAEQKSTPDARFAAGYMLTTYKNEHNWVNLESLARLCLKQNVSAVKNRVTLDSHDLVGLALLEQGKSAITGADFKLAVVKLYDFSKNFSDVDRYDEGYFLLSTAYEGGNKHTEALQTTTAFVERFPKSKFYRQSLLNGSDWAAAMAEEDATLSFNSRFIRAFATSRDSELPRITQSMAELASGKQIYSQAAEALRWRMTSQQLSSEERASAAEQLMRNEERFGDPRRAVTMALEFTAPNSRLDNRIKAEAYSCLIRAYSSSKQFALLQKLEPRISALGDSTENRETLAEIRFVLAEAQSKTLPDKVFNIELKNPLQTLSRHIASYTQARSAYVRVCEVGETSWCAPALYQSARMSEHFITTTEKIDLPKTVSDQEEAQFNSKRNAALADAAKTVTTSDDEAAKLVAAGKTTPDWAEEVLWSNSYDWNFHRVTGATGNGYVQWSSHKND